MTADRYDPPDGDVLNVVADEWVTQLQDSALRREPRHPLLDVGDAVPPHVDEFDVGYCSVDTWHGGNPGPALTVIRQTLLDADAIIRLRPSAIGALERRDVRWAMHHGLPLPKPLTEHHLWEVTDVNRFETIINDFLRHPRPLSADVREAVGAWSTQPETTAGAPERGRLLDDFIDVARGLVHGTDIVTETRVEFHRYFTDTDKDVHATFAEQLWRWLHAEGALRKPTPEERIILGDLPDSTRVWDRHRFVAALPEVTIDQ